MIPSFILVVALGWAYRLYGGLSWVQAVFYGVGAAVIGIIALSAYKLTTKAIARSRLLCLAAAGVTIVTESEEVLLFLGAGVLVWLVRRKPGPADARGGAAAVGGFALPSLQGALASAAAVGSATLGDYNSHIEMTMEDVWGAGCPSRS